MLWKSPTTNLINLHYDSLQFGPLLPQNFLQSFNSLQFCNSSLHLRLPLEHDRVEGPSVLKPVENCPVSRSVSGNCCAVKEILTSWWVLVDMSEFTISREVTERALKDTYMKYAF